MRQTAPSLFLSIFIAIFSLGLSEAAEVTFIPRVPKPNTASLKELLNDYVVIYKEGDAVRAVLDDPASVSDIVIEALPYRFKPIFDGPDILLMTNRGIVLAIYNRDIDNGNIRFEVRLAVEVQPAPDTDQRFQLVMGIISAIKNSKPIKFYGRLYIQQPYNTDREYLEREGITVWLVLEKVEF